jgi:hypothetical protein
MKKLVVVMALCALGWGTVSAQGNGNNGNNGANQSQSTTLPNATVVRILRQAQPYFEAHCGINLGQLLQQYRAGNCVIELVASNPPVTNVYSVRFGGIEIVVILEGG